MQERVQKFLARAGVASRRQAEQLMLDGRVTVNGAVARELGLKLDPDKDAVKVDGKRVHGEVLAYVLLYKPKNTICTLDDPEQRPTVMELVRGVPARLFPVGRLDFDTTGVLLLTNDGEMANLLMHPRHRFSKTYIAKVRGVPTEERLEKLRRGVSIEGVRTAPAEVRIAAVKEKNSLVEMVLREGRNRQVKRMFLEIGHPVMKLHRSAYAFLTLEGMEPGAWRRLLPEEVQRLRASAVRAGEPGASAQEGFRPRLARPLKAPRESRPRTAQSGEGRVVEAPSRPRPRTQGGERRVVEAPREPRARPRTQGGEGRVVEAPRARDGRSGPRQPARSGKRAAPAKAKPRGKGGR